MPRYDYKGVDVTYWDVHYVRVESVILYANGNVSLDYILYNTGRAKLNWITLKNRSIKTWLA